MSNDKSLAVLIPCYNEELTIGPLVDDFKKVMPEAQIYVFDNNSSDKTSEVAKAHGAITVFSPKQGKGHVVRHMFDDIDADVYLMVDGDNTYPASEALKLYNEFQNQKGIDMLVGTRLNKFEDDSFRLFHQFGNKLVAFLISTLFGSRLTDVLSGARVFSREFVKTIPLRSKGFEIETEMTLQAASKGFVLKESPIEYGVRPEGSYSKLNTYSDGILILRAIFMIFKDYRPMIFYTFISLIFMALSLAAGYRPIMDYVESQFVSHVPLAILAAGLGILSVIFLSIGLILDTVSKYHLENFTLWKKSLKRD